MEASRGRDHTLTEHGARWHIHAGRSARCTVRLAKWGAVLLAHKLSSRYCCIKAEAPVDADLLQNVTAATSLLVVDTTALHFSI